MQCESSRNKNEPMLPPTIQSREKSAIPRCHHLIAVRKLSYSYSLFSSLPESSHPPVLISTIIPSHSDVYACLTPTSSKSKPPMKRTMTQATTHLALPPTAFQERATIPRKPTKGKSSRYSQRKAPQYHFSQSAIRVLIEKKTNSSGFRALLAVLTGYMDGVVSNSGGLPRRKTLERVALLLRSLVV